MALQKFTNITPAELKSKGVISLADKPNVAASYGVGGLSPAALKLWFDQIGIFIADKINSIHDVFGGGTVAEYIKIKLIGIDGEDKTEVDYTLQDLLTAFKDGRFAKYLLAYSAASETELKSLQAILNDFASNISSIREYVVSAIGAADNALTIANDLDGRIYTAITIANAAAKVANGTKVEINAKVNELETQIAERQGTTITVADEPQTRFAADGLIDEADDLTIGGGKA